MHTTHAEVEQQVADLGLRAAHLDLFSADPDTPYWMRQRDAETAEQLRRQQVALLEGCARSGCPACRKAQQ